MEQTKDRINKQLLIKKREYTQLVQLEKVYDELARLSYFTDISKARDELYYLATLISIEVGEKAKDKMKDTDYLHFIQRGQRETYEQIKDLKKELTAIENANKRNKNAKQN